MLDVDVEVAQGVARVRDRVVAASARAGRRPDDVRLIAVSKFQPDDLVRAAAGCGVVDFAENYARDLRDRSAALADVDGLRWHLIGPLQRNKVKYVAASATAYHALDDLRIAEALSSRREERPLECFVQVNIAGESTKAGLAPPEVPAFVEACLSLAGIAAVGLMCMPPDALDDPEANRRWFAATRELAERVGLERLSMGTSGDFDVAIEEGATDVRVGRIVFGARLAVVPPEMEGERDRWLARNPEDGA